MVNKWSNVGQIHIIRQNRNHEPSKLALVEEHKQKFGRCLIHEMKTLGDYFAKLVTNLFLVIASQLPIFIPSMQIKWNAPTGLLIDLETSNRHSDIKI